MPENRAGQFTGLADRTVAAQPVFHCVGIQVLSLNLNLSPFVIINYICIYSPVDVTIYRRFDFFMAIQISIQSVMEQRSLDIADIAFTPLLRIKMSMNS